MKKGDSQALDKILSAGRLLMLEKGYNGTTLDEICALAGVTKGALFHHFASKEDLAVALLEYHWVFTQKMLSETPCFNAPDPLKRLQLYVDLFIALGKMDGAPMSCLFGNLTQELGATQNKIIHKCNQGFTEWINQISTDLTLARQMYEPAFEWQPEAIAEYFISIYEGSLILVKARNDRKALSRNMEQFRSYLDSLFVYENGKAKIWRKK